MHFSVRPLFDFFEEMYSRNHSAIAITRNKRYRKTSATTVVTFSSSHSVKYSLSTAVA